MAQPVCLTTVSERWLVAMRRVVAGVGADGRSTVVVDAAPGLVFRFPDQTDPHRVRAERVPEVPATLEPGQGALAELWMTEGLDLGEAGKDLTAGRGEWRVECPEGATRFRRSVFSPGRRTAMHSTMTLDYDIVVRGSLSLLLEDGSRTALEAGDAVVLPGVVHAWEAGPSGAELAVVMIGMAGPRR